MAGSLAESVTAPSAILVGAAPLRDAPAIYGLGGHV